MREKEIDNFCKELAELWKKVPDKQFGRFMCDVLNQTERDTNRDPYYVADEEYIDMIKEIKWIKGE